MDRVHSNAGRPSLACQRCRQRKIKCDLQTPRCGHCSKRGVDCVLPRRGGNSNIPVSRDQVQALENRLAQLKNEFLQFDNSPPSMASDQVVDGETRNDFMSPISVSTMGFSEAAPKQFSNLTTMRIIEAALDTWTEQKLLLLNNEDSQKYCDLSGAEAHQLVQFYRHNVHAVFPFVDLQMVEQMSASGLTALDSISAMVLAIASLLRGSLGSRSFYHILTLVSIARRNMAKITENESNKTLQILLLLTLFSLFDAGGGSSWHLIGAATQVALSLGLHQIHRVQVSPLTFKAGFIEFWTTYVLDRVIALALDKPFGISNDDITTSTDLSAFPETAQLSEILDLAHTSSQWRTRGGGIFEVPSERFDARRINDGCDLFYIFYLHIKTWFLGPPFPKFDRTPSLKHYSEYTRLVGGDMVTFRLPWVAGYSLLHSCLVKELVCLLVIQSEPEDSGDEAAQSRIQYNALFALCSQFPSLGPLMRVGHGETAPSDGPPMRNAATMRLLDSLRALKMNR